MYCKCSLREVKISLRLCIILALKLRKELEVKDKVFRIIRLVELLVSMKYKIYIS